MKERHYEYPLSRKIWTSMSYHRDSFSQCLRYIKKTELYLFIYDYDSYLNFFLFVGRKKEKN